MKSEHEKFLNLVRLPASIDPEQAAILLGVTPAVIAVLTIKGFLKPLGKPAPNAPRKFSSVDIEALAKNPEEMHRMHQIMSQYWRVKNGTAVPRTPKQGNSAVPSGSLLILRKAG